MRKLLICLMLVALLSFSLLSSTTFASSTYYDEVSVRRGRVVAYGNLYYVLEFTQDLGFDYTVVGSFTRISRHYNKGIRFDVPSYPFFWEVLPRSFRWYENGSLVWSAPNFVHYQPPHHINPPWGGRWTENVTFYLSGNMHGARISSSLESHVWPQEFYFLSYGRPSG